MTHTMIWTFGFLAFFLLLILVSKIGRGKTPFWANDADYKKLATKSAEHDEKMLHRIDQIGLQLGELQTQLSSMERILKEVE